MPEWIVEWVLRHTLPFLLLVMLVRWVLRPAFGKRGVVEVLMVNAIGDMASHAAFEEGHPLTSGLGAVALWVLFGGLIAWVVSKSARVGAFLGYFPEPVEVIRDGTVNKEAMGHLRMSRGDLSSELRKQGVEDASQVELAMVEPDGALAVRQSNSTGAELQRLVAEIAALRAEVAALRRSSSAGCDVLSIERSPSGGETRL
ncbi:MAG: hypothetical protein K0R39_565 [Symbiobacteriaceae bacterium]|nr:hypothetical protein [Symbiobacteriaceae bacterium]